MSTRATPRGQRRRTLRPTATVMSLVVGFLLAATGIGAVIPAAQANSNGFWSLTPPPLDNGTVPDVVKLELAPGSVTSVPVVVTNKTDAPITIKAANQLSPVAISTTTKGAIDSNEATKWATITNSEVTAAARRSQVLTVRFRIPTSAKSGDYAAQLVTFGSPVTLATGVKQDRSLTLRFSIRVTGDIKPAAELSTLDVQGELLFFRLTNTGNTLLEPKISLQGLATDGTKISVLDVALGELFPGESRAIQSPLGTTPKVLRVTVAIEGSEVVGEWPQTPVGAAVVKPGEVPPPPPNPGSTTASLIVFALIGLFVIILIWWAVATRNARKRRMRERQALIDGARQAEMRGEAAAAAAATSTNPEGGQSFPPPAGAPVAVVSEGALTLAAVAAGITTLEPLTPGRPAPAEAPAGSPFPPPTGAPVDAAPGASPTDAVTDNPPAPGTPFPPPNGAPVG